MFKHTSRQRSLFSASQVLGVKGRRRLERTWAQGFRERVFPVLLSLEGEFADLYHAALGRPNGSVARTLGVLLLGEMLNLDDQSAVDALAFDARWQHALDQGLDEAYLTRRSVVGFRARLVAVDPEMERLGSVFERIGAEALKELGLSTSEQRLDSTRITSNIRTGGRVALFRETLEHFGRWLVKRAPDKIERLSAGLREWLGAERTGWFAAGSKAEQRRKLEELAGWLYEIEWCFAGDEAVREAEPYALVVRILDEHCRRAKPERPDSDRDEPPGSDAGDGVGPEAAADGSKEPETVQEAETMAGAEPEAAAHEAPEAAPGPVEVFPRPAVKSGLQSPHDPDAGYGHKGSGYHVQITETCQSDKAEGEQVTCIITDFDVTPANVSDQG